MQQIIDLHIHSRYSRSCSPRLTLENIDQACRVKGVDIVATGDFTYSDWFSEIKNKLETIPLRDRDDKTRGAESGFYKLRIADDDKIKFILSTEVALIYKDGGRARRIHIMLHAPSIEAVEELNKYLDKNFNIRSDGRPILGLSAPKLVDLCLSINPRFLIYPAHIWTPWFAVFGSKSGFDSMEECFHEQTDNIYALETGLSSDPAMNWRLSALDRLTILSNSDAHSLVNIGREANVFEMEEMSYDEMYEIIKNKIIYHEKSDKNKGVKSTIEFYPEEGMYHYDGHRLCGVSLKPEQTKKNQGICPACKKPLTIGVLNRVEELADRPQGFEPSQAAPFIKLVELDKIIAEAFKIKSRHSEKVKFEYNNLIKKGKNELNILLNLPLVELEKITVARVAEGINRIRQGQLIIKPGFDGQYGSIRIFNDRENNIGRQASLLD